MANTLITVNDSTCESEKVLQNERYFQIEKLFSELTEYNEGELEPNEKKAAARIHLGAISQEDLFKPEDLEKWENSEEPYPLYSLIKDIVLKNLDKTNLPEDLIDSKKLEEEINKALLNYYKQNSNAVLNSAKLSEDKTDFSQYESAEFVSKSAINNAIIKAKEQLDQSLKNWVNNKLNLYLEEENFDRLISDYIKYNVTPIINKIENGYAKLNVENYFTQPQAGKDPTKDNHLTTRRFVNKRIAEHLAKDDHGLKDYIEVQLKKYVKEGEVLKAYETYDRKQIHSIINIITDDAIKSYLKENQIPDLDIITELLQDYVRQDGTTSFKNPQKGKDAIQDTDLVTLRQLKNEVENSEYYWVTSGPVETTVGFLEDNTVVPKKMSIQEVLDTIFYGKKISITTPETGSLGETVDITICISGDLTDIDIIDVYYREDSDWIYLQSIDKQEFEDGCITISSNKLEKDTEFKLEIQYMDGDKIEEYSKTKLTYPLFVGIIPKNEYGAGIKYSELVSLSNFDPLNNKFYNKSLDLTELTHYYNFDLKNPVKLILAIPKNYPDLVKIQNDVQTFSIDSFYKEAQTTFYVEGNPVLYKVYYYKQPLVKFDSNVTFKF